jgi:hypothetical protein
MLIEERPLSSYESTICNNIEYQELEQQILRQERDLAEAESITENLSTALAGLSVKTGKITEKISILAGQLEKAFLSLIIIRKKEAVITLKNECTICRLIAPRTKDHAS